MFYSTHKDPEERCDQNLYLQHNRPKTKNEKGKKPAEGKHSSGESHRNLLKEGEDIYGIVAMFLASSWDPKGEWLPLGTERLRVKATASFYTSSKLHCKLKSVFFGQSQNISIACTLGENSCHTGNDSEKC